MPRVGPDIEEAIGRSTVTRSLSVAAIVYAAGGLLHASHGLLSVADRLLGLPPGSILADRRRHMRKDEP